MKRPAILAVMLGLACTGFMAPALADGDNNDPFMKLFLWDGGYYLETRPQHMKEPKENEEQMMDRPVDGKRKMPIDAQKPGMSPKRS